MKRLLILPIAILGLASCGDNKHSHDAKHDHAGHSPKIDKTLKSYKTHDPMCGMEKDSTWTHYSVYNTDTVWFCAEHCKKGFDINPEKYTKGI